MGRMRYAQDVRKARNCGYVHCAFVTDSTDDLAIVLANFGLFADPTLLIEVSRAEAIAILTKLLWKDMAYGVECMPLDTAREFADAFVVEHESSNCKYYSNVVSAQSNEWYPLTTATFDSGIIISSNTRQHACLWFEDED
jgi:hypothetical protein